MSIPVEQVTEADLETAASFIENWEPGPETTVAKLAKVIASVRIAAEEAQKERDAVIASRWGHLSADQYQNAEPDDQREHVIARLIAAEIRGQGR